MISVILSEETHKKSSGGSTLGSDLNAQSRGRMTKRGSNYRNHGKSRGNSKGGGGLNREDRTIAGTVENQGIKRKFVGIERKMKEIN